MGSSLISYVDCDDIFIRINSIVIRQDDEVEDWGIRRFSTSSVSLFLK